VEVRRACLAEQGPLHQQVEAVAGDVEAPPEVDSAEKPSCEEAATGSSGDAKVLPDSG
jgi:hypothetical protein